MNWVKSMVERVKKGKKPSVPQIEPEKEDPVCGETAKEAYKKRKNGETPFVNPFHAEEMEKMRREEQ